MKKYVYTKGCKKFQLGINNITFIFVMTKLILVFNLILIYSSNKSVYIVVLAFSYLYCIDIFITISNIYFGEKKRSF